MIDNLGSHTNKLNFKQLQSPILIAYPLVNSFYFNLFLIIDTKVS